MNPTTKTVHLFVLDTLADWEPGYAVARLNSPDFQTGQRRYTVDTVGTTTQPVTTMGGVKIMPDTTLDRLRPADSAMLILPGADTWDEGKNMEAVEKAREFLAAGIPVAAICGATAGLARGGLLDDRQHTSNARDYLAATGYKGGKLYREEAAVTDRNVITAAAMFPLDFAYHILRMLEVYPPATLDAWYGLFKTGDAAYFMQLQEAAGSA